MSDYFDRVERQIVRNVEAGLPRPSHRPTALGYLATAAAVVVVIVVGGVFLLAHGSSPAPVPATSHGVAIAFRASGIEQRTPPAVAIDRSAVILRERLDAVFPGVTVTTSGDSVIVEVPNAGAGARARVLALAVPGRLAFYDWEADAIAPNGKTVASQLPDRNPTALEISQGSGSGAPGDPGAGGIPRGQAAALASRCTSCVVLEAVTPSTSLSASSVDRSAQFYVLRDLPTLSNRDITHPHEIRDSNSGASAVSFGFTTTGATAFRELTKRVARRGDLVSSVGQTFDQHFAIAIDDHLISVPFIGFKQYPDGIDPGNGADISGAFTAQSARDLATILRYGPLPVRLTATG